MKQDRVHVGMVVHGRLSLRESSFLLLSANFRGAKGDHCLTASSCRAERGRFCRQFALATLIANAEKHAGCRFN